MLKEGKYTIRGGSLSEDINNKETMLIIACSGKDHYLLWADKAPTELTDIGF